MNNGNIDLKKISNSLDTLNSIDNCLNNVDLKSNFYDIYNYIKSLNFEHGNFTTDYKYYINSILDKLTTIKKDVYNLTSSVNSTYTNFQEIEGLNNSETGKARVNFRKNDILASVTQIPAPEVVSTHEKEPINTVPIGLGIAATGISASIGAIIVDSKNPKTSKSSHNVEVLEDYKESSEESQNNDSNTIDIILDPDSTFSNSSFKDTPVTPYHASRDKTITNKFYDEED